jgi:hypothetical protein
MLMTKIIVTRTFFLPCTARRCGLWECEHPPSPSSSHLVMAWIAGREQAKKIGNGKSAELLLSHILGSTNTAAGLTRLVFTRHIRGSPPVKHRVRRLAHGPSLSAGGSSGWSLAGPSQLLIAAEERLPGGRPHERVLLPRPPPGRPGDTAYRRGAPRPHAALVTAARPAVAAAVCADRKDCETPARRAEGRECDATGDSCHGFAARVRQARAGGRAGDTHHCVGPRREACAARRRSRRPTCNAK